MYVFTKHLTKREINDSNSQDNFSSYLLGGSKSVCKHLYSTTKQILHPMKMNYWSFYVTVFTNWALVRLVFYKPGAYWSLALS